jgi:hypothetical protein
VTTEQQIANIEASIKKEAVKLKSILEQKDGEQPKLSENEKKGFLGDIDSLEKEFSDLKNNIQRRPDYTALNEEEKELFWQKAFEFKKAQLYNLEQKISAKIKIDTYHQKYFPDKKMDPQNPQGALDDELENESNDPKKGPKNGAEKKWYANNQIIFVSILGAIFVGLLVSAVVCGSTNYCGDARDVPFDILNSQFMLALIGGVIAPFIVSQVKQRFDIQIEQSQVEMIMKDAIGAVKLYQNEANKLRDKEGKLSPEDQTKLRDLAFDSIKTNYDPQRYKEVISSVGAQVFDRGIEEAVKRGWIERFPLEKQQVEAIIQQSIDAVPQIVEWKNLDESVKKSFLDGHVKRLLANLGLEGWGLTQMNEIFEAEVNKRLAAAAIADAEGIVKSLYVPGAGNNKYLKYTSTVMLAAGQSLLKPPK